MFGVLVVHMIIVYVMCERTVRAPPPSPPKHYLRSTAPVDSRHGRVILLNVQELVRAAVAEETLVSSDGLVSGLPPLPYFLDSRADCTGWDSATHMSLAWIFSFHTWIQITLHLK